VRRGYDAVAARYAAWRVEGNPAAGFLADLDSRLSAGSNVLELGCGNGRPAAVALAGRHAYTGVDISSEQIVRARALLPSAQFISHFDAATNRRLVRNAALEILRDEIHTMTEAGHGETSFLWILARA
jgi:SAM-dependent methyltransferase